MGIGISVLCQNCGYEKKFTLGVGMLYSSLEKVIHLVPYRSREKVLDILRNHKVNKGEFRNPLYDHRLFRCLSCNQLHGRFYVKIEYDDNKVYETKFNCSKCKKELKAVENEEDVKNYPCPKCDKTDLSMQEDVL